MTILLCLVKFCNTSEQDTKIHIVVAELAIIEGMRFLHLHRLLISALEDNMNLTSHFAMGQIAHVFLYYKVKKEDNTIKVKLSFISSSSQKTVPNKLFIFIIFFGCVASLQYGELQYETIVLVQRRCFATIW